MNESKRTIEEITTKEEDLSFFDLFLRAFTKRYANFTEKATRKELWTVLILGNIISLILAPVFPILALIFFIPAIAIWTRRIRDTGLPGWWGWLFIPTIIPLVFIAFTPTNYFKSISKKVGEKIDDSLSARSKTKDAKDSMESLSKAHALLEKNVITQAEFDKIKKDLMD